ncbi:MAG: TonB-dependent receptor [Limisphaerales bacterium]|jgi:TonB-dependent receptor
MKHTFKLLITLVCIMPILAKAQMGTIRGTVIEDATGEPLIFVNVILADGATGTTTDFDGKFELQLDPGIYTLNFSFLSFRTLSMTDVEVKAGEVNVFDNIRMQEETATLEEVVITAKQVKNTEAAIMTIQRKSPNLINGISSQTFKKIGDGDAAGAVKRVTGVSVEGGKYVYVRGLGDRYTKTMLNGMSIPGLDPDRNSLQIDIFPTNLIDNIIVMKSSLAEMPADFTGGVVDIVTKDFPDEKVFDVSFGMDYNPTMHFNSDFLTYGGGDLDWLGFDDGSRELYSVALSDISTTPSPPFAADGDVSGFLNNFSPELEARKQRSKMDYSFGVSLADQISLKSSNNTLGYIFSGTYKNSTSFIDDLQYGEYQNRANSSDYSLDYATRQNGAIGTNNVLLGGLAGLAYKTKNAKFRLTVMHLQNGESKAAQLNIDNSETAVGQSGYLGFSNNLEWAERSLTNILLNGKHHNNDKNWEIDWRLSPTLSKIDEPDIRKTAFTVGQGDPEFNAGAAGTPSRIWRSLEEINLAGRLDFTKEFSINDEEAKLKFGASQVYKDRDYEILSYTVQFFGSQPDWGPNATARDVWQPDNLYPNGSLYLASGNTDPNSNEYKANSSTSAGYVSLEFEPINSLKAIVGLRGENFTQKHTGRDQSFANSGVGNNLDNQTVLQSFDLFPSVNLVKSVTENQNIRLSYSKTIARPSFKENSFAQILDPITDRIFNGARFQYLERIVDSGSGAVIGFDTIWNGSLVETRIDNFDIRWELYGMSAENVSVSGFYKSFKDPIELVRIPQAQTSSEFQPRNVGDAKVYGVELEFSKKFDVGSAASNIRFSGNLTFAHSEVEMTDTEYESRVSFTKDGEEVSRTRQMAGQAPMIVNAGVSYADIDKGLDVGFFYNLKGRTLTIVGGGLFPDVYTSPYHSLNFNLNKNFGRLSMNVGVNNILDARREEVFSSFQSGDEIFGSYTTGTSFGLGVTYSIL